jgi:hypothetical protein
MMMLYNNNKQAIYNYANSIFYDYSLGKNFTFLLNIYVNIKYKKYKYIL